MRPDELEDDIRAALRRRGASARVGAPPVLGDDVARRGRWRWQLGAVAASLALVAAGLTVFDRDDRGRVLADAASETTTTSGPARSNLPYLVFEGERYARVEKVRCTPVPTPSALSTRLQAFAPSYAEGPMLFVESVPGALVRGETRGYGLLTAETGEPVTVRGVGGFAREAAADGAWVLTAELPEGDAIAATTLGFDLDVLLRTVDALDRGPDGTWTPTYLPSGIHELPPSTPGETWCSYGAYGEGYEVGEGFEVNLYSDYFDDRVHDRANSTVGPIERVEVDGLPAALGAYSENDHWVLLEAAPGQALEIRAAMTRDEVKALLVRARFVDEAAWEAAGPG